jgi:hypothetical protein
VARRNRDAAATLTITGLLGVEMKCLRVYADEQGESHFSEMEIAMAESANSWSYDPEVQPRGDGAYPVSDGPCRGS